MKKYGNGADRGSRDRVPWIETAKGIGILLVVSGHAPRDIMRIQYPAIDFAYFFIYTFHMHFFFFLSGFVYEIRDSGNKGAAEFIKGKIRTLLVPWGLFTMLVYALVWMMDQIPAIAGILAGTFLEGMQPGRYLLLGLQGSNPYCTHIWYMYVLFLIQLLVFLFHKLFQRLSKKETVPLKMWIGLEIAAALCLIFFPVNVPVASQVEGYILYYIWGIICCRRRGDQKLCIFPWMFIGIIICIVNVTAIDMGMCENGSVKYFIYLLQVFVGASLMILLLTALSQSLQKQGRWIQWLGRNSFAIYLFHQPFACAVLGTVLIMAVPAGLSSYLAVMLACIIASFLIPMLVRFLSYKVGLGKIYEIMVGGRI